MDQRVNPNNLQPNTESYNSRVQRTSSFVDKNAPTFSYSNQARPMKTPEPKIGPSKADMTSNERFIEHRTRSATQIERDNEGWVRAEPVLLYTSPSPRDS